MILGVLHYSESSQLDSVIIEYAYFQERGLWVVKHLATVRYSSVLIWIVEAIGLLNLISVPFFVYFSRHTGVSLQVSSISSVIVYHQRIALSHSPFLSVPLALGGGGEKRLSEIVSVYVAPAAILRCGCVVTARTSVTSRYIQYHNGLGADGVGRFIFIPAVKNGGASSGWREIGLEGDRFGGRSVWREIGLEGEAEVWMGGVYERFKVCPIGTGEQAREMEENEWSDVRSRPLVGHLLPRRLVGCQQTPCPVLE
jgi:hypothetical protein